MRNMIGKNSLNSSQSLLRILPITKDDSPYELLRDCESRLIESRRSVSDALDLIRRASDLIFAQRSSSHSVIEGTLGSHHEELVSLVISALDNDSDASNARSEYSSLLIHQADEHRYRMGRRPLTLTDSEKHVLDILWRAMPEPVTRKEIHEKLYGGDDKAALGAIDVFVSKLRQKLKLASGGRDFIRSVRGRSWALKTEYCRNGGKKPGNPQSRRKKTPTGIRRKRTVV